MSLHCPERRYATSWREAAPRLPGARNRFRSVARYLYLSILAGVQSSAIRPGLTLLYCHYVFDDQREQFNRLLIHLKMHGTFVDSDTCLAMAEGKCDINRRYFHLSFDDGFRNIFTNALPILQTLAIPALIFVPSAFVGADWDVARRYCLETGQYRNVIEMIQWKDLKEMAGAGYEIGSHTRTHARFSTISGHEDMLRDELHGSKQDIEERLGVPCRFISWPYGERTDADAVSLRATREAGYRACFSAIRGCVVPARTDLFRLPRHHFEVEWPFPHIRYFALSTGS